MPNAFMYDDEEMFVVLETNHPETFLTPQELFEKLKGILATMQDDLPNDLQKIEHLDDQVQSLLETSCELDLGPDQFLQWYIVRLEKE